MKNSTQLSSPFASSSVPLPQDPGFPAKEAAEDRSTRKLLDAFKKSPRTETLKTILHYAKMHARISS